jgi:hypothetical protein
MKIKVAEQAKLTLFELEKFVETKNTKGAGKRFLKRFIEKVKAQLSTTNYSICKHKKFAALKLKCFFINDWVIAFETVNDEIIVRVIIHGSLLT